MKRTDLTTFNNKLSLSPQVLGLPTSSPLKRHRIHRDQGSQPGELQQVVEDLDAEWTADDGVFVSIWPTLEIYQRLF